MTLSLLLNNGQLTLPKGGKLPQSTSCCCDLSPPPCDNCIDSCFYFVEVTSPKEVSLKTPAVTCQNGARNLVRIVSDREDAVPTWIDAAPESLDPTFGHQNIDLVNFPTIVEGVGNINLGGYILEAWEGNVDVDFLQGGMGLGVGTRIGCSLYCDYNQAPPSMYLDFGGWVLATTFGGSRYSKPGQPVSDWRWEFNGTIPVTLTQCRDVAQQLCYANATSGDKWLGRLIATPLTFTIDKNGCSLGGSMISRVLTWNTASAAYEHVLAAGEAVRDAFSYTFKITSRPSCHEVPADCDVPIGNGDMTVVIATDPSQPAGTYGNDSFILGTEAEHQFSGPNDTTVRIQHFGAAAGDAGDPYLFYRAVLNQSENYLEEQYIELFCASDNTVTPAVSRWYVRIETLCYPNPGYGWTIDEWIGQMASYESPGSYVGINEGDPVPLGEPDLVHSAGYPSVTPGGTYCEPPAPARFTLSFGGG